MADQKAGTPAAKKTGPPKGTPRPTAAVSTIDWNTTADDAALFSEPGTRSSKWADLLAKLYDETVAMGDKIPRSADGTLKYVRLGTFGNVGGARTQVKALEDKKFNQTFDFKTKVIGGESHIWARVKEV